MKIGQKIQIERKRMNLTQERLAEELNISRQAIAKWENNDAYPELEKVVLLSSFFNVSTDYLLKDDIEEPFSYYKVTRKDKKYFWCFVVSTICISIGIINSLVFYIFSKVFPKSFYDLSGGGEIKYGFFKYVAEHSLKNLFWFLIFVGVVGIIGLTTYIVYTKKNKTN